MYVGLLFDFFGDPSNTTWEINHLLGDEDCEFKIQYLEQYFQIRNLPKFFKKVQSQIRCPQLETQGSSPEDGARASLSISKLL